jgi:phosphopantothenate synthetase
MKNDINYFFKEHDRENPFNEKIENELMESVNVTHDDIKEQQDLKHQRVMIMIQNQWEEKMKQLKIVRLIFQN